MAYITRAEAVRLSGLDEAQFLKFVVKGGEIKERKIGNRWYISSEDLQVWKENYQFRCADLTEDDYVKALEFAIGGFYGKSGRRMTNVEWGQTKRRDIGEYIANQAIGKLGEIAFQRFLVTKFNVYTRISFDYEGEEGGQDIFGVKEGDTFRPAHAKVSIKCTKATNFNLWVVEGELASPDSASNFYVLARVNLPGNHLLRFLREDIKLEKIRELIPPFSQIKAELAGFTTCDELKAKGSTLEMRGADGSLVQELRTPQYVMLSGELKRIEQDWRVLANAL